MEYIEKFVRIVEYRVKYEEHVNHLVNEIIVEHDGGSQSSVPSFTLSSQACYDFIRQSLTLFGVEDMEQLKGKHAVALYRDGEDRMFAIRPFNTLNSDAIIFKRVFGARNEND